VKPYFIHRVKIKLFPAEVTETTEGEEGTCEEQMRKRT
jgi:hypothetical protein